MNIPITYHLFWGDQKLWRYSVAPPDRYMGSINSYVEDLKDLSFEMAINEISINGCHMAFPILQDEQYENDIHIEKIGSIGFRDSEQIISGACCGKGKPIGVCLVFWEELRIKLPQIEFNIYFMHRLEEIALYSVAASLIGEYFNWQKHLKESYGISCASCRVPKTKGLSCPEHCIWNQNFEQQ